MRGIALAVVIASTPALAQDQRVRPGTHAPQWAAGLTLIDPTGITFKRYLGGRDSFDLGVGFLYGPGARFYADYLRDFARVFANPDLFLDLYAGLGGFVGVLSSPCGPGFLNDRCNGDIYAGARVPLGAEVLFRKAPFTAGLELAPGFAVAPGRAGFLLDFMLIGRALL
jgi:hypothetical protein